MKDRDGYSRLDAAGVSHVESTRRARFDLRDHRLTRADLGLDERTLGPIVGGARSPVIAVTLEAPSGNEEIHTSTFSAAFNAAGADADYFTWFESFDSAAEADRALQEAVRHWGFREKDRESWQADLNLADGRKQQRSIGPVESPSGLVVDLTLRAGPDGQQTHQFQVSLRDKDYTPSALAELRKTGSLPTTS